MRMLWRGLLAGGRVFRQSPGLAAGVAVTIGLGLGGCLAIIGLLHEGLLAALPYHDPSGVVVLQNTGKYYFEGRMPEGLVSPFMSIPDFRDVQAQARSLSGIGGADMGTGLVRGGERPRPVSRLLVTEKLLPLLGPRGWSRPSCFARSRWRCPAVCLQCSSPP
jgi:hypothetical protein